MQFTVVKMVALKYQFFFGPEGFIRCCINEMKIMSRWHLKHLGTGLEQANQWIRKACAGGVL